MARKKFSPRISPAASVSSTLFHSRLVTSDLAPQLEACNDRKDRTASDPLLPIP